ncbi:eukaryotic translation initiation factor 2-alpha kinase 1 isoform X2 [Monomorium pharaonis]|uniref:eukaryotic translation initiation factor 2-alpha kinase 1 isoform X2 n=1 Tax=Monomorium pharaonis TaxID=307658 RepID=UPI00063FA5FD|nr:eukaryotic translation initiation factor 2-alpha kinase 1 isoform X2 [Monomorium pharaonis]
MFAIFSDRTFKQAESFSERKVRTSGKFGRYNLSGLLEDLEVINQFDLSAWRAEMEHTKEEQDSTAKHKTMENTEQTDHPWNTLETITTFDQGMDNSTSSTFRINSKNNQNNGEVAQRTARQQAMTQATGVLIESLLQQLCAMLEGDKVHRNKLYSDICDKLYELQLLNDTYNTVEFDVLKGRYQRAFYQFLNVARAQSENKSVLSIPRFLVPKLSRYQVEFQEICFIARGGFGKVYKALHRLDHTKYAIKKIIISVDRMEVMQQQVNEVRTLAKLNHTNIVSYNAAWTEPLPPSYASSYASNTSSTESLRTSKYQREESKSSSSIIEDLFNDDLNLNKGIITISNRYNVIRYIIVIRVSYAPDIGIKSKKRSKICKNTRDSIINQDTVSVKFEELDSSDDITEEKIVRESNIEEYTEESDVVSFRNSNENSDQAIVDTDTSNGPLYEESTNQAICTYTSDKNQSYYILYIQMALCEQTLEQWLRGKISITPEPMVRTIFQQILNGVDYIHSQKIVHHDIKPSNIFISTSGQLRIQLGDFGLACPLQKRDNHHSVGGTHVYAAPEQLQGKCDPKSDIYSIGVVLIELLISMKTRMELVSIISSLKSGKVPETLKQHKWAQMVKQLVQEDPINRPSTSQLLQDLNQDKDVIINKLENTIVHLKDDNRTQADQIQMLQQEVALLKEKIQQLSLGNITK